MRSGRNIIILKIIKFSLDTTQFYEYISGDYISGVY